MASTTTNYIDELVAFIDYIVSGVPVFLDLVSRFPGFLNYVVFSAVLLYLRAKYLNSHGNTFYLFATVLGAGIMGLIAFYADTLLYLSLVMGLAAASPSDKRRLAHEDGALWSIVTVGLIMILAPTSERLLGVIAGTGIFITRTYIATGNQTMSDLGLDFVAYVYTVIAENTPIGKFLHSDDHSNRQDTADSSVGNRTNTRNAEPVSQTNANSEDNSTNQQEAEPVNTEDENDDGGDDTEAHTFDWEDPPDVTFGDIGGYDGVKEQLCEEVINPLMSDKEGYDRFNVEPTRGLLFHGPPGTGKTMFARALANTLEKDFVELTQADLTHKHINESPQIIQAMFEQAQKRSAVIFIDEAEQLIKERDSGGNSHQEDSKITNTFLTHLSKEDQDFILILTTNKRGMMDDAILRQGRVDSKFEVGLPNNTACEEIIKNELRNIPHDLGEMEVSELGALAVESNFSGADISGVFERAKVMAAQENAEFISVDHLIEAFSRVQEDQ